ncbi:Hypothetical predicted protein [Lecanosticta acicola]|uniref:Uncharacterized protein n=1 Tax=Lecanosticta acicola TaxID=111012 RepID=A0AAI9EFL3_9PEZI|nr:Hypothetical predicted protein [Lecanosticta acicola]
MDSSNAPSAIENPGALPPKPLLPPSQHELPELQDFDPDNTGPATGTRGPDPLEDHPFAPPPTPALDPQQRELPNLPELDLNMLDKSYETEQVVYLPDMTESDFEFFDMLQEVISLLDNDGAIEDGR